MDRIKKIEVDIKREVSFIINTKIKDPRVGFVTVTDVRLSSDYKWLNIFFSVMGDEWETSETFEGLNHSRGFIKRVLKGRIKLRNIPEINFIYDNSIDHGMRITEILEELNVKKEKTS